MDTQPWRFRLHWWRHPSSVWGFYDRKKCYIAPINHKKPGKEVRIEDTTPYTS